MRQIAHRSCHIHPGGDLDVFQRQEGIGFPAAVTRSWTGAGRHRNTQPVRTGCPYAMRFCSALSTATAMSPRRRLARRSPRLASCCTAATSFLPITKQRISPPFASDASHGSNASNPVMALRVLAITGWPQGKHAICGGHRRHGVQQSLQGRKRPRGQRNQHTHAEAIARRVAGTVWPARTPGTARCLATEDAPRSSQSAGSRQTIPVA